MRWLTKAFLYAVLVVLGAAFLLPFAFALSTGLKAATNLFDIPLKWFARPIAWTNFVEGWTARPFSRFLRNTVTIAFFGIVGNIVSCSIVAYGFARIRFAARNVLFVVLLATMMVPVHVTIVPLFLMYHRIGWIDTFLPLIVPSYFAYSAFYVFLLRQFMLGIPDDLEDAAKVDGCNRLGVYWKIILPLCKPALATVGLFAFVYYWNDFFEPLVFISSEARKTITLGLILFRGIYDQEWHLLMAVTVIVAMPCALVFLVAQRYFIEGITITGMKA